MRTTLCVACSAPLAGQPAYRVAGMYWANRRWNSTDHLICAGCHAGKRGYFNTNHRELRVSWTAIVGRGETMPPAPCAACGQQVIRNAEALLKQVTCSAACSTSLTRTRNGNQGSGQPCEECGTPITTGRADSVTCSSACRQKAYRRRKTAEVKPPRTAPPLLDTAGRRMPQRSQVASLRSGVASLSGLSGAFARINRIDGEVSADELARWRADLTAAQSKLGRLHSKLRARSGVTVGANPERAEANQPAKRKNLESGTASLAGMCMGFASIKALSDDVTPEMAAGWQEDIDIALTGIRNLRRVLDSHPKP